jgi:Phasin protein
MTVVVAQNHPLECQMSKRKPATASKHAHSPKIAAQRANQAIIRSPKDNRLRSVAAGSTESPPKRHNDSKQEAPLVENPATALQDDCKQAMRDNDSKKGFDFSSATENVRAYQAKLLEMAQANMQLAFEFAQRLGTIRSPVEILNVIAEFTNKRIAMFQKYSVEIAELSTVVVSPTSKMDWTFISLKRSETGVGHPS